MDAARLLVANLRAEGYDDHQIKEALCDGTVCADLLAEGYTQEDIEEAYETVVD